MLTIEEAGHHSHSNSIVASQAGDYAKCIDPLLGPMTEFERVIRGPKKAANAGVRGEH